MNKASEEEVRVRFGQNIWCLRARRGITQEHLVERAEIHRTQMTLIETGRRSPRIETVVRLAGALEVPVSALYEGIRFEVDLNGRGRFLVEPLDLPTIGGRVR
jgi:transcriptional regulator with XRE-family HTH domain